MLISHAEHNKEIVTPRAPISFIDMERPDYGNDECALDGAHRLYVDGSMPA